MRLQEMKVNNDRISVNPILSHVVDTLTPVIYGKPVRLKTNLTGELNITADAVLLKAVFTNLLSCACRMATDEINISGSMDGGLANILISCTPGTTSKKDIDFRVALALETASKMNGAVICEQSNDGHCIFQIILQA